MSDTPEVDAREWDTQGPGGGGVRVVPASFARKLERERDEARALNTESFCCGGDDACAGGAGCQCHALRAEVERLRGALQELALGNAGDVYQTMIFAHNALEQEPTS